MSYVNTGKQRARRVKIEKKVEGTTYYTEYYSIVDAFTHGGVTYPILTVTEFRQLSPNDYSARLSAFKGYVQSLEGIASIDDVATNDPNPTNTTSCPIGE